MILFNPQTKKDYFISLKRTNGEEATICPICSEDRNKKSVKCFSFNHEKQVGKCNHCNCSLIVKKEFEVKREYVRPPKWNNKTELSDKLVKWFEARKIKQQTLIDFKVSEAEEFMPQVEAKRNCIQFNYFRDNEIINIKSRDGQKNFKLFKGAELIFYNLDSIKESDECFLVEGELDAMSLHQSGFKNVVSVPNGAGLNKINLEYLDNCIDYFTNKNKIYLCTDSDTAGRNLQEQLAERLGKERCYKVTFSGFKDANECLMAKGIEGIIEGVSDKREFPLEGVFTIEDFGDEIDDIYNNGLPKGSKTMMGNLNEHIKFHKGYLTTITGTPGSGKTSYLDQMVLQLGLVNDWKVAFYSPESKPTSLHISNLCCKLVGKKWWGENRISQEEIKLAKSYLNDRVYFIEPKTDFSLDSILDAVKGLILRKGVDCFIVDSWNRLEHKYTVNETKYIGESLDKLTAFCKHYNVHCFLVAHPTKVPKQKNSQEFEVPNLYSISGSANFYNKTDVGICVHRNYSDESTMVYIQKVKFQPYWGKTGHCQFKYDKETGRYNEYNGGVWMDQFDRTPWIHSIKSPDKPKQETGIIENKDLETPF